MSDRTKGVIAIIVSAFGFAMMAMFVRLCDDYGEPLGGVQKSFFRNIVAFAVAAAAFRRGGGTPAAVRVSTLLVLRSVLGTAGIFANFYALGLIPIAEAQTLNKTAPFFTVVFAWLFLGEKAGRSQIAALAVAFIGMVLIAKPGFADVHALPLAAALLGGVCAGAAYTCLRALRRRDCPPAFIVLFFSAFSCAVSAPITAACFVPMTWPQTLILLGAGAGAAIGQFGVTTAYGYAAPRDVAVYDYTNILFTAALGFLFFGQIPDALSLAGFAAVIFAAFIMSRRGVV
ncbi:MAG: DMT family transporter [Kiritimatiellae bacterium]|nr:DMT family transporter [Kiritimatiellia bacterium]